MGMFGESVLTRKGLELLAKAQAEEGATITITKAAAGAGRPAGELPNGLADMEKLDDEKQTFPLTSVAAQNETNVFVKFQMTNNPQGELGEGLSKEPLAEGYPVNEVGLYAKGADGAEALYAVAVAAEGQADWMPSYDGILAATIMVDFLVEVASAGMVDIVLQKEATAYDEETGKQYRLGVEEGIPYVEEVKA